MEKEEKARRKAEYMRNYRAKLKEKATEKENEERLRKDRDRKREDRDGESEEVRLRRHEANRIHTQEVREGESEEERLHRQEANRLHTQAVREGESEEERLHRQEANRLHTQAVREGESEEERQRRQEADRIHTQAVREGESEEERQRRQEADRIQTSEARQGERQRRLECIHVARTEALDVEEYLLGSMSSKCNCCNALHFEAERNSRKHFATCCAGGQIVVPEGIKYPQPLSKLLSSNDEESKHFISNIRKYNSMFAFASFGSNGESLKLNRGPKPFLIHGQVYHCTAKNFNPDAVVPVYSHLYILDPEFANRTRAQNPLNKDCRDGLIRRIGTLLQNINPYAQAFKIVFIPRLELDTQDNDVPFRLKRKQFPLRLAYSMTITKSQGQTFDHIGIYLPQPVFAHGQLYTAFSRVKSYEGLKIAIEDGRGQGKLFEDDPKSYTNNVVYRELL